jgi:D-alanyl-D-alanine carboxypeptidase
MAVSSHNGATVALARAVGQRLSPSSSDPVGVFVGEMNNMAVQLGTPGVTFGNPSGLNDVNRGSAGELALLFHKLVMRYTPEFKEHFGRKNFTARGRDEPYRNHLHVIGEHGIDIGKSGLTNEAGFCAVFSAERSGQRITGAILHAGERSDSYGYRDQQIIRLTESAFGYLGIETIPENVREAEPANDHPRSKAKQRTRHRRAHHR